MRVLVLGGAGEIGRAAARLLAAAPEVEQLVIADLSEAAATAVAAELGSVAVARQIDVADQERLVALARESDVVVNTVGPYFRFGPGILSAVIEAGRNYIDVCDDPAPTATMLEMHDRAVAAGVTAVLGMGASPGVANLLARQAVSGLDQVESVVTGWNLLMAQPQERSWRPSAAIVHGIEQVSTPIPVIRGGAQVREKPLRETTIDYPGIGPGIGWTFGHPEPVTLARTYPQIVECVNVAVAPRYVIAPLAALGSSVRIGLLSRERAATVAAVVENVLPSSPLAALDNSALPPLFALATGTLGGDRAAIGCALGQFPGLTMAEATGIPLAVGTLLNPDRPGVHPPEAVFEPAVFFQRLAPYCLGNPRPESMVVVTNSQWSAAVNAAALDSGSLVTALLRSRIRPA
ncbi:saccharopine dehydrogenase NADP-binding domain-containing protein [Nocardia sp. NPDC050712]|uniref:saccharopine dehydrogenase family protein n=1 Tax=Nocardia sp. NPDC050712 TaxID=3155518 RepID=UPI0033CC10DD